MCGRFEQSHTSRYYATALGADTSIDRDWLGDCVGRYNVYPSLCPWMILLYNGKLVFAGMTWGYRTPKETEGNKKPWINARIEKALTGRYFRICSDKAES